MGHYLSRCVFSWRTRRGEQEFNSISKLLIPNFKKKKKRWNNMKVLGQRINKKLEQSVT